MDVQNLEHERKVEAAKRVLLRRLRANRQVCISTLSMELEFGIRTIQAAATALVREGLAHQLAEPAETYAYL
jgi:hypothetical protein